MIAHRLLLAATLLAAFTTGGFAQSRGEPIALPALKANINVTGDLVRVGDLIDNAGSAAAIAVYRAPDLGTTGTLQVSQVIATLRSHQVIGVDTRDLKEITVTRLARTIETKEIALAIARVLEHRNGLGDAANINVTFDRDPGDIRFDASVSGAMQAAAVRYDPRSTRFDIAFEVQTDGGGAPIKLRFAGTAVETLEAAVLVRNVERGEVLKSSDVIVERRPKAEVGIDPVVRGNAVGMQARRQLRAAQALRLADLAKPDLVARDQSVTLIYETSGIHLTMRGKALDNGTEGDVVSVMNLQSKRVVSGTVVGRGQVSISPPPSAPTATLGAAEQPHPVSVATVSSVAPKTE